MFIKFLQKEEWISNYSMVHVPFHKMKGGENVYLLIGP